jgi:hypothetical protein
MSYQLVFALLQAVGANETVDGNTNKPSAVMQRNYNLDT